MENEILLNKLNDDGHRTKKKTAHENWCMSMRVIGKNLVIIGTRYCQDVSSSLCGNAVCLQKLKKNLL